MQSDDRGMVAFSALRPRIAQYRFTVSTSLERARSLLASESGVATAQNVLGEFASGRIDPEKFAMISAGSAPLDVVGCAVLERAGEALEGLLAAGDELLFVSVPSGTSPAHAIAARLSKIGSAFGVAALVELVRRRTYDPLVHGLPFEEYPFEKWTRAERKLAPPLVVYLNGANLDPFEMAKFVDGAMQIVLLVEGPCAPAPLARVISPGVFVAQASDVSSLAMLDGFEGPAVVAVMSDSEAAFVHDPRRGASAWQRLQIGRMPATTPRKSIGSRSAAQMREDLALLASLAEQPVFPSNSTDALFAAIGGANGTDPVERLASWVLGESKVAGTA